MTKLRTILSSLKTVLASTGPLNATRVYILARSAQSMPAMAGDAEIMIRPGSWSLVPGKIDAAGRTAVWERRQIVLTLRGRFYADITGTDEAFYTHVDSGMEEFENDVVDALTLWMPTSGGVPLLLEPARILGGQEVTRERADPDPHRGISIMQMSIFYERTIDQSTQ